MPGDILLGLNITYSCNKTVGAPEQVLTADLGEAEDGGVVVSGRVWLLLVAVETPEVVETGVVGVVEHDGDGMAVFVTDAGGRTVGGREMGGPPFAVGVDKVSGMGGGAVSAIVRAVQWA